MANETNLNTVDWDPEADRGGGERGAGSRSAQRLAEYDRLRERCPVAWSDRYDGFWTLTRFDDITAAARDHRRFRSGAPFVALPEFGHQIPISLNPPDHAPYRRMLNKYFAQDRMDALEPRMREFVREHLAPLIAGEGGDVIPALCQPLPARALGVLMNLPDAAYTDLVAHIAGFEQMGWDPQRVGEVIFEVFSTHIARVVAERREHPLDPEQDLLSGSMAMEIDGQPLADEDVIQIGVQMIAAGHATTADALGSAIYRLATNPDIQMRLRRQPELIPSAAEEFLRIETPLPELCRRAGTDMELGGRTIHEGDLIALNYGAANRDPKAFPHPEACIIDRSPNKHLAFGHGIHKCLGAPLARLELQVALEELLASTAEIELAEAPEVTTGLMLTGFTKLVVKIR
ncbi:MAG TPA: cytochrome P450 [Baekduia sp.]|uniref:cytochrome P450 n=1 Tax=Baekduia sp. TaxID=2600305 RepID=UPI002D793EC1|nr:cytochrome P450 [Baekduia sp.]HET6509015.1 cytochrome P450 [Baekduia sp.]